MTAPTWLGRPARALLLVLIASVIGCAASKGGADNEDGATPSAKPQAAVAQPAPPRYDLLLRNGQIVDGSGNPWYYGDVAIADGKVAAVGDLGEAQAQRVIDASGLVVAPGFIDVHTHADDDLYRLPFAENFIRDGVTTIVTGNCGGSVRDVGGYFARIDGRTTLNVATLYGHNTVLRAVKGDKAGELSPEQMERAQGMVRRAMLDGAVGMSTGLIYIPGQWSKTEEIIELQKVAAEFGGIYASHMRSEGGEILSAIDEALRIGRESDCRVQISHFKLPTDVAKRIGGSDSTLKKVIDARAAGQEVWVDQYPYTASSTSISTLLPDSLLANGGDEAKKLLSTPDGAAKAMALMKQNHEVQRGRKHFGYAVIASARSFPNYAGKSILDIATMRKATANGAGELLTSATQPSQQVTMEDQYRTIIDIYLNGGASCVFHSMDETEVENIMRSPLVSVCSDSGVRSFGVGVPHPRGYGSNCRVLGKYVRERKVITLEEAIRKMTSMPALAFRLSDRGLLRAGYAADVTVFDPKTVTDKATFEQPHQYSQGVSYVIVNGNVVMEGEKMTGVTPGRPLYGPGWDGTVKKPAAAATTESAEPTKAPGV